MVPVQSQRLGWKQQLSGRTLANSTGGIGSTSLVREVDTHVLSAIGAWGTLGRSSEDLCGAVSRLGWTQPEEVTDQEPPEGTGSAFCRPVQV